MFLDIEVQSKTDEWLRILLNLKLVQYVYEEQNGKTHFSYEDGCLVCGLSFDKLKEIIIEKFPPSSFIESKLIPSLNIVKRILLFIDKIEYISQKEDTLRVHFRDGGIEIDKTSYNYDYFLNALQEKALLACRLEE